MALMGYGIHYYVVQRWRQRARDNAGLVENILF